MRLTITKKLACCAGLVLAGSLLSACGDDPVAKSESEVGKVDEAIAAALKLESEIHQVTNRLVVDCMTDDGFDTHPLDLTEDSKADINEQLNPLMGSEPPDMSEIPTLQTAEEIGFDVGTSLDPDFKGGENSNQEPAESDPFHEEMTEEYRQEYDKARYGEAYYEFITSEEPSDEDAMLPLEAGCLGEVNKAVYGEPTTLDGAGDEYQVWGLQWPQVMNDWDGQVEAYASGTLSDARDKWATCVEDKGHPYFEYVGATSSIKDYVLRFYEGTGGEGMEISPNALKYKAPKGSPWPFEEARENEIALAVDVATCADETGMRKTMEAEWAKAMEKLAVENQTEIFAWHDALEDVQANAQKLLES